MTKARPRRRTAITLCIPLIGCLNGDFGRVRQSLVIDDIHSWIGPEAAARAGQIPSEYLRGILQACVQDAMRASDPIEQLQRFATQLSIRLIWMDRAYPGIFVQPESVPEAQPPVPVTLTCACMSSSGASGTLRFALVRIHVPAALASV